MSQMRDSLRMKTMIACVAVCATVGFACAEHVALVGPDAVATVVIADKPEESARLAAAELTNHVALVTGRRLDIRSASNASEKGVKVFIGSLDSYPGEIPQAARDYIASAKQDEAAWAGTVDGNLHFVGRHEVAELYSVYHFLESKLGIIWFKAPIDGDPGIYVPKAATIELEPFAEGREPAFKYRRLDMVCARYDHPPYGAATAVRNGFQTPSVLLIDALDKPESDIYRFYRPREWRGEILVGGEHMTMCGPVSVKKYFKEHPEYFALVNGKRTAGAQICFSNPDVWRIVADDVIERFHRNGDLGYFLFGLWDSTKGICECDACKAMDPPPGVGRGISTRFNKCAQRIMELVWREIPTADLRVWAYSNYRDMPIGVLHDPRVKVQFCGIGRCYGHAFDDPNCPCNAKVYELMRGWMKVAPQVYTYEYLACTPMRYTCSEAVEERDIKNYHRLGVVGWKSEAQFSGSVWVRQYAGRNVGFQSCWQWLWMAGKLLWDPSLSGQAIIDHAEEKYYGVAYPAMRRYQALRRRLWNESSVCLGYPRGDPRRPLLLNREGSKEQLLALLDEADALAAAGDDVTRFRVRQDRKWLNEYWIKPNDAFVKRREQAYDVAPSAAAPTIDGKGDDACWAGARRLTDFKIRKDPVPKDQAVDACVLHDAANFYVLVNAKEPNPSGIVVKESKPDVYQWFEDAVMVALAPPGDSGVSYVVWANLDGVVYDTAHPGDDREDWNSGAVAKTERRADGWTMELKIPAVPKMHPEMKAGDYWSLMIVRRRPQNVGESCSTLGGGELDEVIQYLPIRLVNTSN